MQNVNANAKAGVMMRESGTNNVREVGMWVTPTKAVFEYRTTVGGSITTASVTIPAGGCWVKLVRSTANLFTGSYTTVADGSSGWTTVGTPVTISSMASSAQIGIGVTSAAAGTLCTAPIDNVTANP